MDNRNLNDLDAMLYQQVEKDAKLNPDHTYLRDLTQVMTQFTGRRFIFGFIERSGIFTPGPWSPDRVLMAQEVIGMLRSTESGVSLLKTMFSENLKGADNVTS